MGDLRVKMCNRNTNNRMEAGGLDCEEHFYEPPWRKRRFSPSDFPMEGWRTLKYSTSQEILLVRFSQLKFNGKKYSFFLWSRDFFLLRL